MKQNKDLGDAYDRCKLARGENTPAEILCELAKDENWNVRLGVAYSVNTPAETLRALTNDANEDVRIVAQAGLSKRSEPDCER